MPYLDLPSACRLFYTVDDHTDPWKKADTVVFIHGFAENTEAWRAWVPHFSRRYRVVRIDLRGFGRSGAVAEDFAYSAEQLADDVARVITHLAAQPAHVVTAKAGGITAIKLAAMRPELVKTLTLACSPVNPPIAHSNLGDMERRGMRDWARHSMPDRLGSHMSPSAMNWWADLMGGTAIATARAYVRLASTVDIRPDLSLIRCPVLVMTGKSWRGTDLETYRQRVADVEFATQPVAGYHVAGTDPDGCARVTLDFIARRG